MIENNPVDASNPDDREHKNIAFLKQRPTKRAPDPRKSTETMVVGLCAFSSVLRGLKLVPSKWRCLVPPTSG
jgi:hypothetical protein